jgi:hypothetical protein
MTRPTLLILVSFSLFVCPDFTETCVSIVIQNAKLVAHTLHILQRHGIENNPQLVVFENQLISALVPAVKTMRDPKFAELIVESCVSHLFWRVKSSAPQRTTGDLNELVNELSRRGQPEFETHLRIVDGSWIDIEFAMQLVLLLTEDFLTAPSVSQLVIVLSFLCHPSHGVVTQLSDTLESLWHFKVNISPVLLQLARHGENFPQKVAPAISLYERACATIAAFLVSLRETSAFTAELMADFGSGLIAQSMPAESLTKAVVECVRQSKGYEDEVTETAVMSIRSQDCLLDRPHRWNTFDRCFRPFLFCSRRERKQGMATVTGDVTWSSDCQRKTFHGTFSGRFFVTTDGYFFETRRSVLAIPAAKITHVFWNWHHHIPDSFSVFTTTGESYLFRLENVRSRDFMQVLNAIPLPNCVFFQSSPPATALESFGITQQWKNRAITNFEYLMWLNVFSGRSFHDPEMYPVFPFLFATDADGNRKVRDLSSNVAFLNTPMMANRPKLRSCFDSLDFFIFTHSYSTATVVRSLHDNCSLTQFFSDVGSGKLPVEAIPEFFYLPELFEDRELPKWCRSPIDLVDQHISMLESEDVSLTLHSWIDLIWGIEQQRSLTTDIQNSFDPRLYCTVWDFDNEDETKIHALLSEKGQIPPNLFAGRHPKRFCKSLETEIDIKVIPVHASEIIDFHVSGSTLETLKIVTSHRDGAFFIHQFPVISAKLQIPHSVSWISLLTFATHETSSFAFVPIASNSAYFYDFQRRTIVSPVQTEVQLTEIAMLTVGARALVSAAADGTVYAWTHAMRQTGILFAHRAPIVAMYLSDEFGVLASGDTTGQIAISLLPSLLCVHTIDGKTPLTHVLVAEKHGHVLAFDGNRCRSFTVNATPIKERAYAAGVRAVCNAQHLFAMITDDNELAMYDAQTLAKVCVVCQYQHGLAAVRFHRSLNAVVCVRGGCSIGIAFVNCLYS